MRKDQPMLSKNRITHFLDLRADKRIILARDTANFARAMRKVVQMPFGKSDGSEIPHLMILKEIHDDALLEQYAWSARRRSQKARERHWRDEEKLDQQNRQAREEQKRATREGGDSTGTGQRGRTLGEEFGHDLNFDNH